MFAPESESREHQNTVKTLYECIKVDVDGETLALNFYHIGVSDEDEKLEINLDTLVKLTKEFNLLELSPGMLDGNTQIFIDYRSLPQRVFDTATKKFGKAAPNFFSRLFGFAVNMPESDDRQSRYLYVCKPSKITLLFQPNLEKLFRHEYKHFSHIPKNLDVKKEVTMRLASWAMVLGGIAPTAQGLVSINTNGFSIESLGTAVIGGLIMIGGMVLQAKTPTESEANLAQSVFPEENVFKKRPLTSSTDDSA